MKRQSEDLFFKYYAKPSQEDTYKSAIAFNLPSDYSPIAGDIIEIFISEDQNIGYITYYARLLIYKPLSGGASADFLYDLNHISGKLALSDNTFVELDTAGLSKENGVEVVTLYAPDGKEVLFDKTAKYLVNLIVHRSKASIDLYYL